MSFETQSPQSQITLPLSSGGWTRAITILIVTGIIAGGVIWLVATQSDEPAAEYLTHTVRRGELIVSVIEQGTLESSENTEIKCKVRGQNTITSVIKSGTKVIPGDVLVRLDTLAIEEAIAERTKYALSTKSGAERAKADMIRAELAIREYLDGQYQNQLMLLEQELSVAQTRLRSEKNWLQFMNMKAQRGFLNQMRLKERNIGLLQAASEVKTKLTDIDVLKRYTKKEQMETLKGNFAAAKARWEAESEREKADNARRDRALAELEHCVVIADRAGLVIYPSAASWKNAPDIEEGANVHKDQVLLLMPDLSKMQVKVGIHESIIDKVKPGLDAIVSLPGEELQAKVTSVATVTRPAGWWTGNVVKYDTVIQLPEGGDLKPGMSAEVNVILAKHSDVISVPVAAVLETDSGSYCWVESNSGIKRRQLDLGDSNDVFVVVESGLAEGDEVVLNPLSHIEEAQSLAKETSDTSSEDEEVGDDGETETDSSKSSATNAPPTKPVKGDKAP